jgi:periplasmic copper chaperone A
VEEIEQEEPMFRKFCLSALALMPLPALACAGLTADDPFARVSGTMAQSGAVYMTLINPGSADCRLVAARSEISERVELHTHREDAQGVMRMIELEDGIVIPAGGEHRLERGGDHVMFMGLTRAIEHGEIFGVTLVFEDGSELAVEVPVDMDRMGAYGPAEDMHEDHPHEPDGHGAHGHDHHHGGHRHGD